VSVVCCQVEISVSG